MVKDEDETTLNVLKNTTETNSIFEGWPHFRMIFQI